jgi:1,4-dihydroxy-2-naphthoate octaprenyltransferase
MLLSSAMAPSWIVERYPRLWVVWAATRPSQIALIVLIYAFGVGMTTTGGPVVAEEATVRTLGDVIEADYATRVLVGLVALLPVAVTIHYANETADVDTDARTAPTPFSGGSRALVETDVSVSFLRTSLLVSSSVAIGGGLAGVLVGALAPTATVLLFVGLVAGAAYSLPPVALVRRGAGEPVNMLLGGLVLPVYGVSVVARPTFGAALATVPFTLVVGCNLLAVHWPDRHADRAVGKRTRAVQWSRTRLRRAYATLAILAGASTVCLWWWGVFPDAVALAHLAPVPFLVWGWMTLTRQRSPLPAVAAMVVLALTATVAWWWVGVA